MVEKLVLCLLAFAAMLNWGAFAILIGGTSPEALTARLFFFAVLFAGVLFTFSALAYYLSLRVSVLRRRRRKLRSSVLLGISPAAAAVAAMWLQSFRVLGLASGLTILGVALVVELVMSVTGRGSSDISRIQEVGD
ncbi:MAG: hypothetical protein HYX94_09070 [Chloroflexi bacterium]|nr:hypothetical protein [Chloroflexota bacterium]